MRRALDGNPPITLGFGVSGWGYFGKHAGYDYGVVNWTAKAPEKVTVINVWTGRETVDGGNIVEMQGQYTHRFLHMKSISVKVGDVLAEGTPVGITGNTGNVGYHLHHDVRKNGTKWTDSFSNYIDWEKLISTSSAGGDEVIPDQDNYYWRYNKAMQNIRGRQMTREEFRKNFVGRSHLTMLEAMLDNPEADKATDFQQWALTNRASIEKRVIDLQNMVADLDKKLKASSENVAALTKANEELNTKVKNLESQLAVQSEDTQLLNGFGEFLRKLIQRLGLK